MWERLTKTKYTKYTETFGYNARKGVGRKLKINQFTTDIENNFCGELFVFSSFCIIWLTKYY